MDRQHWTATARASNREERWALEKELADLQKRLAAAQAEEERIARLAAWANVVASAGRQVVRGGFLLRVHDDGVMEMCSSDGHPRARLEWADCENNQRTALLAALAAIVEKPASEGASLPPDVQPDACADRPADNADSSGEG